MKRILIFISALLLCSAPFASAQVELKPDKIVEGGGTGPYKAIVTGDAGIPDYTIYRPADLQAPVAIGGKLPVILFGNGGCANSSEGFERFLTEIASHGYIVIAIGPYTENKEFSFTDLEGSLKQDIPVQRTDALKLKETLDWLAGENANPSCPYYRKVNMDRVAAMGQSCGGVQALVIGTSGDKRIKTVVCLNSGVTSPGDFLSNVVLKKDLKKLSGSIAYLIGGESDIAYKNAADDFSRIGHIPVTFANTDVGHGGTYGDPHGGSFAQVALDWLDYTLKGKQEKKAVFLGKTKNYPEWTFQSKRIK